MVRTANVLIFLLVFVVGGIVLQIFLSKQENKWAGLILPIISFGFSLLALLGVVLFSAYSGTAELTQNGEIIEQTVTQTGDLSAIIVSAIYVFALCNIPTAILLAIYAACRGKDNRRRALEKMSVQDLE